MANFRKRDNGWEYRISYKDSDGKYKQKSKSGFKTKALANQAAIEAERTLQNDIYIDDKITLLDYFKKWSEIHKKPNVSTITWKSYENTYKKIKLYFEDTRLNKITSSMYQEVINRYAKTHSQETVERFNVHVKSAVSMAVYEGLITRNFCTFAKVNSQNKGIEIETKFLEVEEYLKLLEITSQKIEYQSYFILYLISVTGVRFGECLGFTQDDIDEQAKIISVNKTWDYQTNNGFKPTKTKSSIRKIPLDQYTLLFLDRYKRDYWKENDENRIFSKISNNGVNKTLRKIVGRNVHAHSLRHTYASYLISKEVDLISISKVLGHENLTITLEVYAHQLEQQKEKNHNRIRKIFETFGADLGRT